MELAEVGMIWLLISNLRCIGVSSLCSLTPVHLRFEIKRTVDLARLRVHPLITLTKSVKRICMVHLK